MKSARWSFAFAACLFTVASAHGSIYLVKDVAEKVRAPALRAEAGQIQAVFDQLAEHSGVDATLYLSSAADVNAYATIADGKQVVVVNQGLVELMQDDRDAIAAVLGHELGHHKADHIRKGRKKKQAAHVFGAILGAVVGAKLGSRSGAAAGIAGGAAVGVGTSLLVLKFDRTQEMEADQLSLRWMAETGYDPRGMLRVQKMLATLAGSKPKSSILSTHPTSEKRYKAADQWLAKNAAIVPEEHAIAPLVDAKALAEANTSIKAAEDARIAQLLKPADAPAAALVAPLNNVPFARYAALSNEMLYVGDKGEAALLAKNKLTKAQWTALGDAFTQRARGGGGQGLMTAFSVEYFRATQGRFAAHGRDLADSYEKGQALKLDPPYPLETEVKIAQGLRAHAADPKAPDKVAVLAPYGLTEYDHMIGQAWWMRRATVLAMAGDSSLLGQLLARGAPERAAAADADDSAEDDGE